MKRSSAILLVAAALFTALTAGADPLFASQPAMPGTVPASAVELYTPPCLAGPFDGTRFLALLRVELGAIGISDVRAKGAGPPTVPLPSDLLAAVLVSPASCDAAAAEVTIQVVDRATAKIVQRSMAIADIAFDERARAIAIAVAELLQASWAELELGANPAPGVTIPPEIRASIMQRLTPPPPSVPPFTPAAPPPSPRYVEPRPSHSLVEASALLRAFPSRDTALLGGALAVSLPLGKAWQFHAGADLGFGDAHVAAGGVTVGAVTGSAGVAKVAGTVTTLEIGPRLHAGYAWGSGTSSREGTLGTSYGHFVALALLSATLRVPAQGFSLLAGLDAGAAFVEASFLADNARAAGVGGVAFGARIGAALGI